MGVEIEHRFVVRGTPWTGHKGVPLVQGYLARTDGVAVRVRRAGPDAWITVKGPPVGAARPEFEYAVPVADAEAMLSLCGDRIVRKVRYRIPVDAHTWDVDVFEGLNAGLALAEVELAHVGEDFARPPWAVHEVTGDGRFANVCLAEHPWSVWSDGDRRPWS